MLKMVPKLKEGHRSTDKTCIHEVWRLPTLIFCVSVLKFQALHFGLRATGHSRLIHFLRIENAHQDHTTHST